MEDPLGLEDRVPDNIYSKEAALGLAPEALRTRDPALERFSPRPSVQESPVIWTPNAGPQTMFLQSLARECLLGGAVGGGKTDALVMGALRWVYNPYYRGIILRREKDDLREAIDRAREIYGAVCPGASKLGKGWIETRKRWEFPSGAYVLFGSAQREDDVEAYKTFEFPYVGFDELTTFTRKQYVYMISRNRVKEEARIPTLMRAGTNPDGPGHRWVYKRFIEDRDPFRVYEYPYEIERPDGSILQTSVTRQFIPSTVFDNPMLGNLDEYVAGLMAMGPDLANALLYGKWDYFRGQMFPYDYEEVDPGLKHQEHFVVRCMDYGWTDPTVIYWLVVYPRPGKRPLVEVAQELMVKETSVDGIVHIARQREEALREMYQLHTPRLSVADPSTARSEGTSGGMNILDMFNAEGFWFEKANPDRQSGWAQVRRFLEDGRLKFWRGQCPYLLQTMPKLVRDPGKADDIRSKQDDHGADALRYGLMEIVSTQGAVGTGPAEEPKDPRKQDTFFDEFSKDLLRQQKHGRFGHSDFGPGF